MAERSIVWDLISQDRASATNQKVAKSFDHLEQSSTMMGDGFRAMAGAAKWGAIALGGLGAAAVGMGVKTAASMESAQIGFETLLGSAKKANAYLAWMKEFAAKTPFEMSGLIDSSRLLIGAGASAKEAKDILQAFGDTAGAVAMDQTRFQMAMSATSQIISAGKINLGDMNQLMNDGIPIWRLMSAALGKPVSKLRDMISSGDLLTKDVMPKLLAQMEKPPSEGGFLGAMARQSTTLTGLWSTLMDTINQGMGDVIKPLMPEMKKGLGGAIKFVESALKNIPGWVEDAKSKLKGLDFTSLFESAKDAYDRAKAFGTKIVEGIQAAAQTGDWKPFGEFLGASIRDSMSFVITGITDWADTVDWVNVGKTLGETAIPFTVGFLTTIFDPLLEESFWTEHWQEVFLAAISFIPVGKGGSVAVRLVERLGLNKGMIGAIAKAGEKYIGTPLRKLADWAGKHLGDGFKKAAPKAYFAVRDFIETSVLRVWLAKDAVVKAVTTFVNRIPTAIGTGLGKIAEKVYSAGKSVVDGFIRGLQSKWGEVQEWFGRLTDKIPTWKGPRAKDESLLTPAGTAIMRSLVRGLDFGEPGVKKKLTKITDLIGKALDSHKSKLSDLRSSYADLKASVRDAFRLDMSNAGGTFSDVMANFQQQIAGTQRMAAVLSKLRKLGLRSDLLGQIAAQGVGGIGQANSILEAGKGGVSQLNQAQASLMAYGTAAGTTVAAGTYGSRIADEVRAVRRLEHVQRDLTAAVNRLNHHLSSAGRRHVDAAMLRRELQQILGQGRALGAS